MSIICGRTGMDKIFEVKRNGENIGMQFGKGILPAKEYLSNGLFSIQNCYSEAESSFNQQLHFHDFYELSLIYEGSSRFLINGSSFVAAAGSLQLIRPSDYHRQMTDTGKHIL